jgi:hypothetical protein
MLVTAACSLKSQETASCVLPALASTVHLRHEAESDHDAVVMLQYT